jgi:hypothetical protein
MDDAIIKLRLPPVWLSVSILNFRYRRFVTTDNGCASVGIDMRPCKFMRVRGNRYASVQMDAPVGIIRNFPTFGTKKNCTAFYFAKKCAQPLVQIVMKQATFHP